MSLRTAEDPAEIRTPPQYSVIDNVLVTFSFYCHSLQITSNNLTVLGVCDPSFPFLTAGLWTR
jgi:hypothetical protein